MTDVERGTDRAGRRAKRLLTPLDLSREPELTALLHAIDLSELTAP